MSTFEESIKELQKNNVLVVLSHCGSEWQKAFVTQLAEGLPTVDFADPVVRDQAVNYTTTFVQALPNPAVLYNLQLAAQLVPILAKEDVPKGSYLAITDQGYYLAERLDEVQVPWVELPLKLDGARPFVPGGVSKRGKRDVLAAIVQGELFAQCTQAGADRKQFYASYCKDILQHKIMEQTTVSDDIKFYRFLGVAASLTGTVVNYSNLAGGVGITAPTAKQWLQFLVGAGVVYFVQPLTDVPGKRLMKAPKLYFRDVGLAAYLLQINDALALMQSFYLKNLFDNYVVNVIRESYLQKGEVPQLLFYQDSNYKKISLIVQAEGKLHPVLINKEDFSVRKTLKAFGLLAVYGAEHGVKLGTGCIIGMGKEPELLEQGLYYLPAECL